MKYRIIQRSEDGAQRLPGLYDTQEAALAKAAELEAANHKGVYQSGQEWTSQSYYRVVPVEQVTAKRI